MASGVCIPTLERGNEEDFWFGCCFGCGYQIADETGWRAVRWVETYRGVK